MAPKLKPVSEAGHVAEHGNGFRARIKINGNYTYGRTHPTRELAQANLNAARAGATSHGDVAAALTKGDVLSACTKNTGPEQRGAAEHASPVSSGAGAAEHVAADMLSASTGRVSPDESTEANNATHGPAKKAKTVPVSWAQLEHRAVALPRWRIPQHSEPACEK